MDWFYQKTFWALIPSSQLQMLAPAAPPSPTHPRAPTGVCGPDGPWLLMSPAQGLLPMVTKQRYRLGVGTESDIAKESRRLDFCMKSPDYGVLVTHDNLAHYGGKPKQTKQGTLIGQTWPSDCQWGGPRGAPRPAGETGVDTIFTAQRRGGQGQGSLCNGVILKQPLEGQPRGEQGGSGRGRRVGRDLRSWSEDWMVRPAKWFGVCGSGRSGLRRWRCRPEPISKDLE